MTVADMRQLPGRALTRIVTPPSGTALRDAFGASLLVQGLIRVIDGRLFTVTHLEFGSNALYGALMLLIGVALVGTRDRRTTWYGAFAATMAGMFYLWLAAAVWQSAATSGGQAIVYGYALLIEARAWTGSGMRWPWKHAT